MAKDSVYSALMKPVTEHGRNVFSLDNRQIYSMKAGQITPVKCLHFKPGDYFDIQAHDFSLTFPMNTAAFLRGRKEFSFYSVYYNAVWSLFNQYQAQRQEPKTSAFNANMKLVEPRIPLYQLLFACWVQWTKYVYYQHYCDVAASINLTTVETMRRTWLNASSGVGNFALNGSWDIRSDIDLSSIMGDDYKIYLFTIPEFTYNASIKTRQYCQDIVGHFRAFNWLRKLDMLGYGNFYPIVSSAESKIVALSKPTDDTSLVTWRHNCTRIMVELLMSLADSCWRYVGTPLTMQDLDDQKMVNLYPICAYNSIFYHFFRNSYYDNDYHSNDFSLDFVSTNTIYGTFNVVGLGDFSLRFLDIEYHQWKKDRFTGVLPDQQFGSVSGLTLNIPASITSDDHGKWNYPSVINTFGSDEGEMRYSGASRNFILNGSSGTSQGLAHSHSLPASQVGFDVISLKRSEMLQEYRQLLMRAGNKTTDIFRAIYGESCSSEHVEDIIPRFMETFGEDIFVDPVTATADTGAGQNGNLGDLSARGKFSGSSGRVKFNAGGNFGLIMCLAYVVPTSEYNSYVFDRHLMELTPEDHFIPQFENLGLQDIYNFELNCLLPYNDLQSIGKAPRYFHKKTELDLVHGAFCSLPQHLRGDETDEQKILLLDYGNWFGAFNHWVNPRSELQSRISTVVRDFYINPSILDNVFVLDAGADQMDDQFICNTYFEIRSTKEMTKTGLVNFV